MEKIDLKKRRYRPKWLNIPGFWLPFWVSGAAWENIKTPTCSFMQKGLFKRLHEKACFERDQNLIFSLEKFLWHCSFSAAFDLASMRHCTGYMQRKGRETCNLGNSLEQVFIKRRTTSQRWLSKVFGNIGEICTNHGTIVFCVSYLQLGSPLGECFSLILWGKTCCRQRRTVFWASIVLW